MDAINDFIREILWGLVSGILELLYGVNTNLLIPASNVNFASSQFVLSVAKNLVIPTVTTYTIAVTIYSFIKLGLHKKDGGAYNLVKGIILTTIISGTFYYIAPYFYNQTVALSLPLADTIGSELKQIQYNNSIFEYYRDSNGKILRKNGDTYYYEDTNYVIAEELAGFEKIVFYKTKDNIANIRENRLCNCSLAEYTSNLTKVSSIDYTFSYSVLDTLVFETVVKVANVGLAKAEVFMVDYQSAKVNRLTFDYNSKTKGATWFSKGEYHYQIREFYTAIVGIITLVILMLIASQFLSRSLLYAYDMMLLPYTSAGVMTGNKDGLEYHLKEMLGILVLNIMQLWSFYFCMLFVQFVSSYNSHPLFNFLGLFSGLVFVSRVPAKIMSIFKVQHQGLQNSSYLISQWGASGLRLAGAAVAGGLGMLGGLPNYFSEISTNKSSSGNSVYSNSTSSDKMDSADKTAITNSGSNNNSSNSQSNNSNSTSATAPSSSSSGYSSNNTSTGLSSNSGSTTTQNSYNDKSSDGGYNSNSYSDSFSSLNNDVSNVSNYSDTNSYTQNDNFYDAMKDFDDYFDFRRDDLNE